jgi:hypothetical protein
MKVCEMIDVRLRVFIPARAVSLPIGPLGTVGPVGYDGDNRGFSFDQGTSRAEISAGGTLEPGPFGLIPNVVARFHLNGVNPLEPLAPAINADLAVVVSATGTSLTSYSISGSHDGFPAYEIYIAQRLVYSFDPVAAGTNPLNLAVQDQVVNVPITALL